MKKYDYLIVGSGLFGATFAHLAHKQGKTCLVIDKRPHLGGNIYCENIEGINVHKYGAHIFHTSNKEVWNFVNSIVEFNRYTNSPVANYKGKLYNLPFNMNTFYQMWGVTTPAEAQAKIDEQKAEAVAKMKADGVSEPRNLEEQAQVLIGKISTSVSSRDIPRSNGDESVQTCQPSSSSDCRYASSSTIITSMTNIRESLWGDTTNSSMVYLRGQIQRYQLTSLKTR